MAKEWWPLSERRLTIATWDNDKVCLRAIRVTMAMPGDEVIPSWYGRIAERTFESDTSVLNDVTPKTLGLQLIITATVWCDPTATVGFLVSNPNTMILAQVGENTLGCSLKLIIARGSFIVPPAKKCAMVLMGTVIMVCLEMTSATPKAKW